MYHPTGSFIENRPFINRWLADETKLTYYEFMFNPNEAPEFTAGQYVIKNLFNGFKYAENREEWEVRLGCANEG